MNRDKIIVKNAHTNNLKNINLEIPKHKLVVFTDISGSGKSSLLFDTIYTEEQRHIPLSENYYQNLPLKPIEKNLENEMFPKP